MKMLTALWLAICLSLLPLRLTAQQAAPATAELEQRVKAFERLFRDWAGLNRYGSDDTEIPPPGPTENRVVFIGDQITEMWGRGKTSFFSGKPYFNRGISDQTTAQMLVRFRQDVIGLKPRVVIIQGGTNELTGMMGPGTEGTIGENLRSMTELAKVNGIKVVLASLTPVCDCAEAAQTALRPQGKIIGLNGSIRDYAAEAGVVYLNYYSALVNGRDFKRELTVDGLLPNDAGYEVMAPLAEKAIADALAKK
jgi:lysophospholipase L1-like esterase